MVEKHCCQCLSTVLRTLLEHCSATWIEYDNAWISYAILTIRMVWVLYVHGFLLLVIRQPTAQQSMYVAWHICDNSIVSILFFLLDRFFRIANFAPSSLGDNKRIFILLQIHDQDHSNSLPRAVSLLIQPPWPNSPAVWCTCITYTWFQPCLAVIQIKLLKI